jgi:hypothetical protein
MIPLTEDAKAPQADFLPQTEFAASITATSSTAEYARYVHQMLCSLPSTTLLQALDKSTEMKTIPGLTPQLICTCLPRSTATDKGHMRRHCANTASTRNNHANELLAWAEVDRIPTHKACAVQDMFCFAALADANAGTMNTDLTGAFPVRTFKNMQHIFVAYVYDLNTIIVRPMPSRTDASFITAFTDIFNVLRARQYQPALNVMDNKCLKAVEKHIHHNTVEIQLVPPHNHRVNVAKRAIGTFKEHFVAALATVDMNCPLQLWDEFLPQVELTLNLLRSHIAIPKFWQITSYTTHSILPKRLSLPLELRPSFTMTRPCVHRGPPMLPMVSMSAPPQITTSASVFISRQRAVSVSLTHGGSIQATVRSRSSKNTIKHYSRPAIFSKYSAAPCRHRPVPS